MTIFLIGPANSTFVKHDIESLRKTHTVIVENTTFLGKGLPAFFRLIGTTIRSLWYVMRSDVMISWFSDYYSLLPTVLARLLGKRVFVVAGGFDVLFVPDICGARLNPIRWFCTKNTFHLATEIFHVSHFAKSSLESLMKVRTPVRVIYNGVDVEKFAFNGVSKRRTIVLTISQAPTRGEYARKGLKDFIALASMMPDIPFVLAGVRDEALSLARRDAAGVSNLRIIPGPLSLLDDLLPLYRTAAAYCQFSITETFGLAVVEAMASGCVPIVYPNGSLPEITGSFGKQVHSLQEAAVAVRESFSIDESHRQVIAKHAEQFSLAKREQQILDVLLHCE